MAAAIPEERLQAARYAFASSRHAVSLNGKKAFMETPVKLGITQPFTFEAVLTLPAAPDGYTFVVSDLQTGGLGFGPTPDGRLQTSLNEGKNGKADRDRYKRIESCDFITLNTPTHVAATFDGRTLTLFVNGKMQTEQRHFDTTFNSRLTLRLGRNPDDHGPVTGMLNGTISDVRISNTVRYSAHFTPVARHETDEHTLALYHYDKSQGDRLTDDSGNNNHGPIVGTKPVTSSGSAIDNDSEVDTSPQRTEARQLTRVGSDSPAAAGIRSVNPI